MENKKTNACSCEIHRQTELASFPLLRVIRHGREGKGSFKATSSSRAQLVGCRACIFLGLIQASPRVCVTCVILDALIRLLSSRMY